MNADRAARGLPPKTRQARYISACFRINQQCTPVLNGLQALWLLYLSFGKFLAMAFFVAASVVSEGVVLCATVLVVRLEIPGCVDRDTKHMMGE